MFVAVSTDDVQVNSIYIWGNRGSGRSFTCPVSHSWDQSPGRLEPAARLKGGAQIRIPASNVRWSEPHGGTSGHKLEGGDPAVFSCFPMLFLASSGLHPWVLRLSQTSSPATLAPSQGLRPAQPQDLLRGNLHSRDASRAAMGSPSFRTHRRSDAPHYAICCPQKVLPYVSLNSLLLQPASISAMLVPNWHVLIHFSAFSFSKCLLSACYGPDSSRHWGHSSEQDRQKPLQ